MMKHPDNFEHQGTTYDLRHLARTDVKLTIEERDRNPEMNIMLSVTYSNHVYSQGKAVLEGDVPHFIDQNGHDRWFCPVRHASFLVLPELIQNVHKRKCHFTGHEQRRWLVIEANHAQGITDPYYIIFSLWKFKGADDILNMLIHSAYFKTAGDNQIHRRGGNDRINFSMLARKTLAGEKIKRPLPP